MLRKFTINTIRNFYPPPCYSPSRYLPEDWEGTALDILRVTDCPPEDRLWVVLHEQCIDERTARLFAVWCAREAIKMTYNPNPALSSICDLVEMYINKEKTIDELNDTRSLARRIAVDSGWSNAESAVYLTTTKEGAWLRAFEVSDVIVELYVDAYEGLEKQVDHLIEMLETE